MNWDGIDFTSDFIADRKLRLCFQKKKGEQQAQSMNK